MFETTSGIRTGVLVGLWGGGAWGLWRAAVN